MEDRTVTDRPAAWQRARVVTGYQAHFRLLTEIPEAPIGWIRDTDRPAPAPYSFGPSRMVVSWHGAPAVILETKHRRYEVWRVPVTVRIYPSDDAATDANIRAMAGGARVVVGAR
jgi:hypothetical protein